MDDKYVREEIRFLRTEMGSIVKQVSGLSATMREYVIEVRHFKQLLQGNNEILREWTKPDGCLLKMKRRIAVYDAIVKAGAWVVGIACTVGGLIFGIIKFLGGG